MRKEKRLDETLWIRFRWLARSDVWWRDLSSSTLYVEFLEAFPKGSVGKHNTGNTLVFSAGGPFESSPDAGYFLLMGSPT